MNYLSGIRLYNHFQNSNFAAWTVGEMSMPGKNYNIKKRVLQIEVEKLQN